MRRKSKFFLPARYLLLIMSGVCIIIMLLSFTLNISGGPLNAAAGYVFVPMQEGINKVGTWISDKAANLKNLSDVMAENEDLQNQVDELTTELNTIKLEQYELDNLRELYNLDQKYPSYEKVAANVIGKNSGNWFNTFTTRGWNDSSANTTDFVWNARLSRTFKVPNITLAVDAFDILHQLSSRSFAMNSQGRTEVYRNTLPSYVLAHVIWRVISI